MHCLKVSGKARRPSDDNSPLRRPFPDRVFSYITSVLSVFLEDIEVSGFEDITPLLMPWQMSCV